MADRVFLLLLAVALGGVSARGDEEPADADAVAAAARDPAAASLREQDKQRRAMAGLLALCGIGIGGLMLVLLVMFWGARLRRLARRELPPQKSFQNELWYPRHRTPPE